MRLHEIVIISHSFAASAASIFSRFFVFYKKQVSHEKRIDCRIIRVNNGTPSKLDSLGILIIHYFILTRFFVNFVQKYCRRNRPIRRATSPTKRYANFVSPPSRKSRTTKTTTKNIMREKEKDWIIKRFIFSSANSRRNNIVSPTFSSIVDAAGDRWSKWFDFDFLWQHDKLII